MMTEIIIRKKQKCRIVRVFFTLLLSFVLFTVINTDLWSLESENKNESESESEGKSKKEGKEEEEIAVPDKKIEAIFPEENKKLIFIEGEDAVSTNFNKEPILNYSCSGFKTLQLNRTTGLQGGAAFYSNYVFYVEEGGTYELWYGGTPSGPKDEMLSSYSSPLHYTIDSKGTRPAYRENISVVEEYAPSYYWNRINELNLDAGQHTIRFEVKEKRRYDGKYYFYMDCFFFVKKEKGKTILGRPLPHVFPKDMNKRDIDNPFKTTEDYEIIIRENPDKLKPYIELSLIYTLLSDYLNAIKYLRKAGIRDPNNLDILLLQAKNRIWKGDIDEGLKRYRTLLLHDPKRLDFWIEAGKVAAWTGRHDQSISTYLAALNVFPDDLNLMVNLGLTHLWAKDENQAELYFKKARKVAGEDYELIKALAEVFNVNGYPDRAIDLYKSAIKLFPQNLELYRILEELYYKSGKKEKAKMVKQKIDKIFIHSDNLAKYLKIFRIKQGLKEKVMDDYENKLKQQPDNLQLRELLAQTYFWNGYKGKAINEYLNILVNNAYINFNEMVENSFPLLELIDKSYVYLDYFKQVPSKIRIKEKECRIRLSEYKFAKNNYEKFLIKVEKAKAKGEEIPLPEQGADPQDILERKTRELSAAIEGAEIFVDKFNENIKAYSNYIELIKEIQNEENSEKETFNNIIKYNRWVWNKKEFVLELQSVASKGLVLAGNVLGRTYQFENNFHSAERIFKNIMKSKEALPPDYRYGLIQTLIWESKIKEALEQMNKAEAGLYSYVPYMDNLKNIITTQTHKEDSRPSLDFARSIESPEAETEVEKIIKVLYDTEKESLSQSSAIYQDQMIMHSVLRNRMVRAFYYFEENSFLIRNELGDFYLKQKNLTAAIRQFRQVLAIDPWDISAIYKLGQVYEWDGNWRQALKNYKRVYYADPLYENVTYKYNELARENADTFGFSTEYMADASKINFNAEAYITNPINSLFGINFKYKSDTIRLYGSSDEYEYEYESNTNTYYPTCHVHSLSAGLLINLYSLNLKITPSGGINLYNDLFKDETALENNNEEISLIDFFRFNRIKPFAQLDVSLNLGKFVYLNGAYYFGIYEDTFPPGRDKIFENSGEMDISVDFSFINLLRGSSSRTNGKVEFLTDDNIIFSISEEINIAIVKIEEADLTIKLTGRCSYQNSKTSEEQGNYWSPREILVAGGGIAGSSWLGIGEDSTLGITLRSSVSSYMENIFDPSGPEKRLQIEAGGDFEFSKGDANYSLGTSFSSTFSDFPTADYWYFSIKLGYSTRIFSFITP